MAFQVSLDCSNAYLKGSRMVRSPALLLMTSGRSPSRRPSSCWSMLSLLHPSYVIMTQHSLCKWRWCIEYCLCGHTFPQVGGWMASDSVLLKEILWARDPLPDLWQRTLHHHLEFQAVAPLPQKSPWNWSLVWPWELVMVHDLSQQLPSSLVSPVGPIWFYHPLLKGIT